MARQIVTNIWCDLCLNIDDDEAVYTEAVELPPITIGGMKPRVIAMCEPHRKEWFDGFKELLTDLGVVADAGSPVLTRMPGHSPGSGTFPCPVPDCPKHRRPLKHEQSLRNHVRDQHGSTITKLREQYGDQPVEPDLFEEEPPAKAPKVTRAECDVPGCDGGPDGGPMVYEWPGHVRPSQALGVHKAKRHGIYSDTSGAARHRNKRGDR